jgi:hypothetical protein
MYQFIYIYKFIYTFYNTKKGYSIVWFANKKARKKRFWLGLKKFRIPVFVVMDNITTSIKITIQLNVCSIVLGKVSNIHAIQLILV